jgi:adenylate kinase
MHPDRKAWLHGRGTSCEVVPAAPPRQWRVVLLGGPGSGKGTQAELLGAALGACALSTGDLLRATRTAPDRSPAAQAAVARMNRGELVPDETVLALLVERRGCLRCPAGLGFILDGFPRTVGQAEALERLLHAQRSDLDAVISYEVTAETLLGRLAGRQVCAGCRAVYHLPLRPPHQPGRCDRCPGLLEVRADDTAATIATRLAIHAERERPLLDFYSRRRLLVPVSAEGTPAEILARTLAATPLRNHRPAIDARTAG